MEAFLVRRVETVRLIVIGVQPDWHLRCINAANGTSRRKVDGRLLDEIGRTSYVLERLLRVDQSRSSSGSVRPTRDNRGAPTNDGSSASQQSLVIDSFFDGRLCFRDGVDACHELNKSSTIRRPAL